MNEESFDYGALKPEESLTAAQAVAAALLEQEERQSRELADLEKKLQSFLERFGGETENEPSLFEEDDPLAAEPVFGYGADKIGKIVLEAARYCGKLSADPQNAAAKELVNLILGKGELTKAEILKIVLSGAEASEKRTAIDKQYEQAMDYFESVMAQ